MTVGFCSVIGMLLFFQLSYPIGFQSSKSLLKVQRDFTSERLLPFTTLYKAVGDFSLEEAYQNSIPIDADYENINLDINFDHQVLFFELDGDFHGPSKSLMLEINNALLNHIRIYERDEGKYREVFMSGTDFPFRSRKILHRNFLFPITLDSGQKKTFAIEFYKNKIAAVVPLRLWEESFFAQQNDLQNILVGIYYGFSLVAFVIGIYLYFVDRRGFYLFYSLYNVCLSLYLFSFLGLFYQYFFGQADFYQKYYHVAFIGLSIITFVEFAGALLESKTYSPRVFMALRILVFGVLILRFAEFYLPLELFLRIKPFIIQLWMIQLGVVSVLLSYLCFRAFPYKKKIVLSFALAFSFLCLGTLVSVLNIYTGWGIGYIFGLPLIVYGSFLEIIFLTITILIRTREIFWERNLLSDQLVLQQQKTLFALIEGEDRERTRIGKELHDNIGSRLNFLQRSIFHKYKDLEVDSSIAEIGGEVRNLSHRIAPQEMEMVGLVSSVRDLAARFAESFTLRIQIDEFEFPSSLPFQLSNHLYRIIQEAINNSLKHAKANYLEIQFVGHPGEILLTISDDGLGMEPGESHEGIGLQNIQSRVAQMNGKLTVETSKGRGFSLLIMIPLPEST